MSTKPECKCWQDPMERIDKELRVDGIGKAIQISVDQAVRDLNICTEACPYVAGAVVAGLVFWVAYIKRADGNEPTNDQLAEAEAEIITFSRERLGGSRNLDVDKLPAESKSVH